VATQKVGLMFIGLNLSFRITFLLLNRSWFSLRKKTKEESDQKSELDVLFHNAIKEKYNKLNSMG
jgi:hypothetical protein